jgi:lauroyl/myristoyl acyltransferase
MPAPVKPSAEKSPAIRRAAAGFWLRVLFWLARHATWLLMILKRPGIWATVRFSHKVRRATFANARRISGPDLSDARCVAFARGVVGSFFDFVVDVGRCSGMAAPQLHAQIESVSGREAYVAHRQERRGAIIATAHMGSFEVGLAALVEVEKHIHVVFKRDPLDGFESIRSNLRATLGVDEAAIDDGWDTWMRLRDALENDHVVVMQADRAMPGQKSQAVKILGGHVLLPVGPLKLAQISGSPIIPVFTVRVAPGRIRVFAEAPIYVDADALLVDGVHPALLQLGKVIERYVAAYPEQWLVLDPAFVEDAL